MISIIGYDIMEYIHIFCWIADKKDTLNLKIIP